MNTPHFPLTAIVGQESVKRALMAALVNPRAGGLLISGTRGTAKSVLVRAATPFTQTGRIVELPLGASEDMVFGTIDVEAALQHGTRRLRRGILHRARNTVLYMDEVNLLREDLLAAVLRCAADGLLLLERDGLSYAKAISYTPIGTMDPAEGALRLALLDSFGMFAAMDEEQDAGLRREIVARVLAYERDPLAFCSAYAAQEAELLEQIRNARNRLPAVEAPSAILHFAAACVLRARCAGNHAEIYLIEAARAFAALAGRDYVLPADVEEAAAFVLVHRMSRSREEEQPHVPQENPSPQENREGDDLPDVSAPSSSEAGSGAGASETQQEGEDAGASSEEMPSADDERVAAPLENVMARLSLLHMKMRVQGGKSGRRDIVQLRTAGGRCLRTELPHGDAHPDLALAATLRAAAPHQRRRRGTQAVVIRAEDVRVWVRAQRSAANILFLVDASGSMGARERMRTVKGAILALLQEAYQKRDRVGLIAFRRERAETLLPMTRSVELAEKLLRDLPTGGRTPLAEGLAHAWKTVRELEHRGAEKTVLILITDGRTNPVRNGGDAVQRALRAAEELAGTDALTLVLDTERAMPRVGIAPEIAWRMRARYYTLEQLTAEGVLEIVRTSRRMQE